MWPSQIRENAKQREVARMLICQGAVTKGIPCLLCHISLTINGVPSINNVQVDWIPMVFSRQHLKTQKWICQALIILLPIKAKEGTPNLINMSWKSRGLLMRILTCKLHLKFRTMARNIKKLPIVEVLNTWESFRRIILPFETRYPSEVWEVFLELHQSHLKKNCAIDAQLEHF